MPNILEGLLQGTGQASGGSDNAFSLKDLFEQNLGGYYKGVDKALKESGYEQTTTALKANVPPKEIIQTLAKMLPAKGALDQGGIEQGQQGEITGLRQPGWAADMFTPGGARGNPEQLLKQLLQVSQIQGQQTQTQLGQQKLAGEEPLQKGEKEKLGLQFQQDLVKKALELEKQGNLKPNDIFSGFEQASKAFITQRDSQARIEAMQQGTGYDDLGLIFSFMKVLDPSSVVRESEFANAASAASFLNRTYGQVVKFTKGGRLAPESRNQLIDSARRIFKSSENQQRKTTMQFKNLAERNGINFENVVRDTGIALSEQSGVKEPVSGVASTAFQKTSSGNSFRRIQ